jgi:hypothetical protein
MDTVLPPLERLLMSFSGELSVWALLTGMPSNLTNASKKFTLSPGLTKINVGNRQSAAHAAKLIEARKSVVIIAKTAI